MREPKLEIFKLRLINKEDGRNVNFRDFYRKKFKEYRNLPKPILPKDIFKLFHGDFLKQIDNKNYKINKTKNKAFTIAYDEMKEAGSGKIKRESKICSPFSNEMILTGVLEGGKHGTQRWLGEISDTSKKSDITETNIVNDRYYFLIYTPLDHYQGILMVQGYTESKISDVLRDHVLEYFKYLKEIQSKFEIFVPETFKQRYLEKAYFKKLRFSTGWNIKPFEDPKEKEYELEIKIEIIDKSDSKSGYKRIKEFLSVFGKSSFKPEGGKQRELNQFEKIDAKMESNGKELSLDIENEDSITPVILLKNEGINLLKGNIPDFDQINKYCRALLIDVDREIRPTNAIDEL